MEKTFKEKILALVINESIKRIPLGDFNAQVKALYDILLETCDIIGREMRRIRERESD